MNESVANSRDIHMALLIVLHSDPPLLFNYNIGNMACDTSRYTQSRSCVTQTMMGKAAEVAPLISSLLSTPQFYLHLRHGLQVSVSAVRCSCLICLLNFNSTLVVIQS